MKSEGVGSRVGVPAAGAGQGALRSAIAWQVLSALLLLTMGAIHLYLVFNGVGALATLMVLLVVAFTKFFDGAWMVVVLLPAFVLLFRGIHAHYMQASDELAAETPIDPDEISHQVIVPIASLNQVALQTLAYARSIARGPDDVVSAVHITDDPAADELLTENPFALLIGMMLDQQYPMEHAFLGPQKVAGRFGGFDPAAIAAAARMREFARSFLRVRKEMPA